MDGEDKRLIAFDGIVAHCPKVIFRDTGDDVAGLLRKAADYLDSANYGHAEAVALEYDDTGVNLVVYLHCNG
jgi:hypothetical protein